MSIKRIYIAVAVVGLMFINTSTAYAGAIEDLLSAIGKPLSTSSVPVQYDAPAIEAPTPVSSTQVAASAAPASEAEIESLKKLIVVLTQQLADLLAKKNTVHIESFVSASEKMTGGICDLHRPLSQGVDGDDVKILQRFLISEGFLDKRYVTGSYGSLTEKAVREWQKQAGVIDHGDPYTTGFGLVNDETLGVMQASCLTERAENRTQENEEGASKPFFVKKVPMTLVMKTGSAEKNMELSFTVKEMPQDPKSLRVCWTLVSENDTPLTETDCWTLGKYGTQTQMISSDFSLVPLANSAPVPGHNIVKLKLELFDPSQSYFHPITHHVVMDSLGSDDTGTFDLFVGAQ